MFSSLSADLYLSNHVFPPVDLHSGLQQPGKAAEHLLWSSLPHAGGRHMVMSFCCWLHDQPLELHRLALSVACSDKLKSKLWHSGLSKITPRHQVIYQKEASVHKFTGWKENKRSMGELASVWIVQ